MLEKISLKTIKRITFGSITILLVGFGYMYYSQAQGAITRNIAGLAGITFNTSQSNKLTDGLTHMWSFDVDDVIITSEPSGLLSTTTLAGTGVEIDNGGGDPWTLGGTSAANVTANDGTYASADLNVESQYLKATNFGYSIPGDVVIRGIEVTYERSAEANSVVDTTKLHLIDGVGATSTVNNADIGTTWTTTDTTNTQGSSSDGWGRTWTPAEVNDSGFGVLLTANRSGNPRREAHVDYIDTTIYYQSLRLGTTTDSVGSIDGELIGADLDAGKSGQGLSFNGADSSISFGSTISFKTISFWIKSDMTNSGIINIASTTYQSIDIIGNAIRTTSWDEASSTIYVDGKQGTIVSQDWHLVTITNTDTISAPDFTIGIISTTTIPNSFLGKIDNVRTYDRVLSPHEIQRLYNLGGTAMINSDQTEQIRSNLLANFSFNGSDIRWDNNPTSTALGVPPSVHTKFNGSGVVVGDTVSRYIYDLAHDDDYLYLAGDSDGLNWRIEKRYIVSGSLDLSFGTDGVVTSAAASNIPRSIAVDSMYMYVVGDDSSTNWRIEKRLLSDGSFDTNFDTDGIIDGAAGTNEAFAIAIDSTYMYVTGDDSGFDTSVEKRRLSDGALCTAANCGTEFGTAGIVTSAAASTYAQDISIDSTYLYTVGTDDSVDWRIEKRLLSDGSLVSAFGTSGVITGDAASSIAFAIDIDDTYMYITGSNAGGVWRIEKRLLLDGSLDSGFGSSGVILADALSDFPYAIVVDSAYVYVAGYENLTNWRIEKRSIIDGSLDLGFDDDGVVSSGTVTQFIYGIILDETHLYAGGYQNTTDWRIEKRLLSDGSLDSDFGISGYLTSSTASTFVGATYLGEGDFFVAGSEESVVGRIEKRSASTGALDMNFGTNGIILNATTSDIFDIEADDDYIYTTATNVYNNWRIAKRSRTTGALDTNFGDAGIVSGATTSARAYRVALDGTYMYVVGYNDDLSWRYEKRTIADGSLDTGFGLNGVATGTQETFLAYSMQIDDTYMYVVGSEGSDPFDWHIEKRLLSDGSFDSGFGVGGATTSDSTSSAALDIDIDDTYMYIAGSATGTDWRMEKRLLSTGALDTGFGTGGVQLSDSSAGDILGIIIDDTYLYVSGYTDTADWRTEKRRLSDGSLVTTFGSGGAVISDSISYVSTAIEVDDHYVYIAGYEGSNPFDWRVEKRSSYDGSYADSWEGYPGTFVGPTPVAGRTGQALSFDGANDYVDGGNMSSTTISASPIKTISFWMKADDITTRPVINIDGTDKVDIGTNAIVATSFPASTIYIDGTAGSTITTGWHHVVITDTIGVIPINFQIGTDGTNYFDGILDEVRLYNRVITSSEITRLYRMGKR